MKIYNNVSAPQTRQTIQYKKKAEYYPPLNPIFACFYKMDRGIQHSYAGQAGGCSKVSRLNIQMLVYSTSGCSRCS